jgi:hypothetical protein
MKERGGWVWLVNSTQWHYFKGSSRRALCGKFMLLKLWVQRRDRLDSPGDCAICRRWLRAMENEHNPVTQHAAGRLADLDRREPDKKVVNR